MSDLQDLFEQTNPIPKGITRCGDHYAQTEYMLIDPYAHDYAARFKGFVDGMQYQQARIDELNKQAIEQGQRFNELAQKLRDAEYRHECALARIDELSKPDIEQGQ